MRMWKRAAAGIMAAVLMAGSLGMVSYGEETGKRGWRYEDSNWYYYNSKGTIRKNKLVTEKGKMYFLDNEGKMAANTLLYLVREEDPEDAHEVDPGDFSDENIKVMFAYPDGQLARKKWVQLKKDDTVVTYDVDNSDWYYFDENGYALRNQTRMIDNETYEFHENGKMYCQEFAVHGEDTVYYTQSGARAKGKLLKLENNWYRFDSNGVGHILVVDENALNNDESLRKAYQDTVENITARNSEMEISVGKKVKLVFDVERTASPSNAQRASSTGPLTKHHDIYVICDLSGTENPGMMSKSMKREKPERNEDGSVSVAFTANVPGTVDVCLYIDDNSARTTVTSVIPEEKTEESTKTILNSVFENTGDGLEAERVEAMKDLSGDNEEAQAALMSSWAERKSDVQKLEESYAMAKGIMVEEPAVSVEAASKLGGTQPTVTGAALNMNEAGTMQLSVDTAEEVDLSVSCEKQLSFDISMYVNDSRKSEYELPLLIELPIPDGFRADDLKIYHTHEGEETEDVTNAVIKDGTVSVTVNKLSTFTFAQGVEKKTEEENNGNNENNGNGGSQSSSSSSDSSDSDSGSDNESSYDNSSEDPGKSYPRWSVRTTEDGSKSWKLLRADGRYAAGTYVTREDGTRYEQPAWELVNGAWYAFGADGWAKSGWFLDETFGGWFYVDMEKGMLTGWQLLDGKWYYFHNVSDGTLGVMKKDTQIDGWYVGPDGAWDGNDRISLN